MKYNPVNLVNPVYASSNGYNTRTNPPPRHLHLQPQRPYPCRRRLDPLKQQLFYRPLGGAIEFGEHSREALVRELREEIQAEITNLRYLATLENIYVYNGQPGHEIVQVYDGDFLDPTFYTQERLQGYEVEIDEPFQIIWKSLTDLAANPAEPLYPDGLLQLLSPSIKAPTAAPHS